MENTYCKRGRLGNGRQREKDRESEVMENRKGTRWTATVKDEDREQPPNRKFSHLGCPGPGRKDGAGLDLSAKGM